MTNPQPAYMFGFASTFTLTNGCPGESAQPEVTVTQLAIRSRQGAVLELRSRLDRQAAGWHVADIPMHHQRGCNRNGFQKRPLFAVVLEPSYPGA